jgi:hypothetical protein
MGFLLYSFLAVFSFHSMSKVKLQKNFILWGTFASNAAGNCFQLPMPVLPCVFVLLKHIDGNGARSQKLIINDSRYIIGPRISWQKLMLRRISVS